MASRRLRWWSRGTDGRGCRLKVRTVIGRGCTGLDPTPGVRESSVLGLEGDSFLCSWG